MVGPLTGAYCVEDGLDCGFVTHLPMPSFAGAEFSVFAECSLLEAGKYSFPGWHRLCPATLRSNSETPNESNEQESQSTWLLPGHCVVGSGPRAERVFDAVQVDGGTSGRSVEAAYVRSGDWFLFKASIDIETDLSGHLGLTALLQTPSCDGTACSGDSGCSKTHSRGACLTLRFTTY